MLTMLINILLSLIAACLAILIHEGSKYFFALSLTHPLYRKREDTKVNVLKFFDPIGLILFVFAGIGWQKPMEYKSAKFRDKEKGLLMLSIIGMLMNLLIMLALVPVFRYDFFSGTSYGSYFQLFLYYIIRNNFVIVVVNLLPVPPFDMSKIIYAVSPEFYFKMIQNERIIHAVFILILAFGILNMLVDSMFFPIRSMLI